MEEPRREPACSGCRSTNLRPGTLPAHGERLRFKPDTNWFMSYPLRALACLDCGVVTLALQPADRAKLKSE